MPLHADEAMEWQATTLNGEKYYGLNLLRTFYKLTTSDKRERRGANDPQLRFLAGIGPGQERSDHQRLSRKAEHPVAQDASGELMVSKRILLSS